MPSINIIFPAKPPISILGPRKKHIHEAIAKGVSKALKLPLEYVRIHMATRADAKRIRAEIYVMKGHKPKRLNATRIVICGAIADCCNVSAGAIDYAINQMESRDHTVGGWSLSKLSALEATKRRRTR
ncbi:MAG: hypothetical protein EYC62_05015 [Alphaproteobacteria bacterium]|nr:MAG: hypothetical protein EYC62_05015 [Alphaproteobacteria bacterium]